MDEMYSIKVNEENVEIYGTLTVEETFDFLNFYEKKGYKSVIMGSGGSTLCMSKDDINQEFENDEITEIKEQILFYKDLLKQEKFDHEHTKQESCKIERLLRDLLVNANKDVYDWTCRRKTSTENGKTDPKLYPNNRQ